MERLKKNTGLNTPGKQRRCQTIDMSQCSRMEWGSCCPKIASAAQSRAPRWSCQAQLCPRPMRRRHLPCPALPALWAQRGGGGGQRRLDRELTLRAGHASAALGAERLGYLSRRLLVGLSAGSGPYCLALALSSITWRAKSLWKSDSWLI